MSHPRIDAPLFEVGGSSIEHAGKARGVACV